MRPTALFFALAVAAGAALQPARAAPICWVEFSQMDAPGAMGAAGAQAKVWRNTASGLLVRHPNGAVLIDAGWSRIIQAQMAELDPAKRPIAEQVLASLKWRRAAPDALAEIGARPDELRYILPTHAHYDHMAGAEDLPGAPVLLAPEEIAFLDKEEARPDMVAASDIRALRPRFQAIRFVDKPYLGFPRSFDLYGDGAIVVVPLAGHTPGSVGVFLTVGARRVFAIGDATWVLEAVERDLPKVPQLRAFADNDGTAADRTVAQLHDFHMAHPEIAIVPAHDRTAWQAVFGPDPTCVP